MIVLASDVATRGGECTMQRGEARRRRRRPPRSASPCGTGGIACPAGEPCPIRAVPGFNLTYCASRTGAFLDR